MFTVQRHLYDNYFLKKKNNHRIYSSTIQPQTVYWGQEVVRVVQPGRVTTVAIVSVVSYNQLHLSEHDAFTDSLNKAGAIVETFSFVARLNKLQTV